MFSTMTKVEMILFTESYYTGHTATACVHDLYDVNVVAVSHTMPNITVSG